MEPFDDTFPAFGGVDDNRDKAPVFQVRVSTMASLLGTLTAYGEWRPRDLKQAVEANWKWSEHRQRLFFGELELCDVLLQANRHPDRSYSEKLWDLLDHPRDGDVVHLNLLSRTAEQETFLESLSDMLGHDGDVSELVQNAPAEVRGDRYCMLAVVAWTYSYPVLEFASEELRAEREFILQCVTIYARCLRCIGEHLVGDRAFMEEAIRRSPFALGYVSEDLKNEEALVRLAIRGEPSALGSAAPRFRDMKELVLPCVAANGYTLRDMSDRMKSDREVVLAAVRQCPHAIQYAPPDLQADPEVQQPKRKAGYFSLEQIT
ncbi:LECRK53 [Symbiodinium sp. CCMP2592]|nr:LECRK53 [Symbiodinium sp. CCMP2592]